MGNIPGIKKPKYLIFKCKTGKTNFLHPIGEFQIVNKVFKTIISFLFNFCDQRVLEVTECQNT